MFLISPLNALLAPPEFSFRTITIPFFLMAFYYLSRIVELVYPTQGWTVFVNKYTNEVWSKSNTTHSDKAGEWKVDLGNKEPSKNSKITIWISDGKIIKIDK